MASFSISAVCRCCGPVVFIDMKSGDCPLCVGDRLLPQEEESKHLIVLFTNEGKIERDIDGQNVAVSQ